MSHTELFANFGRLVLVTAAVSISACSSDSPQAEDSANALTNLNADFVVTPEEAYTWARAKHDHSPGLTGSPEWHGWLQDLEERFESYGVVDIVHNSWEFERWETSDGPTDWSLDIDGDAIDVAFYGAYSGGTGPAGITAELVYYDHNNPPASIEGKIVVIPTRPAIAITTRTSITSIERTVKPTRNCLNLSIRLIHILLKSTINSVNVCTKSLSPVMLPGCSSSMTWDLNGPPVCMHFRCRHATTCRH